MQDWREETRTFVADCAKDGSNSVRLNAVPRNTGPGIYTGSNVFFLLESADCRTGLGSTDLHHAEGGSPEKMLDARPHLHRDCRPGPPVLVPVCLR